MKIVNIFGLVVAVHVAVLLMIFAIPGCRTTPRPGEPIVGGMESAPVTSAEPSPIQPAREMTSADLNPPLAPRSSAPSPGIAGINNSSTRTSPTRPETAPAGVSSINLPTSSASVPTTQTYTVVRNDSLWGIAKKHGTTVAELAQANGLSKNASLKIGQTLRIPTSTPAPSAERATTPAPTPSSGTAASAAGEGTTYTIRSGDTLGAIARRHNTSVAALKAMNNLRSDLVRVGDTLIIPQTGETAGTSAPASAPAATRPPAQTTPAATTPSTIRGAGGTVKHVVVAGESLGAIAKLYGTTVGDIVVANSITDPAKVRAGQEIVIPGATKPEAAARPPVPTQYPASYDRPPAPAGVTYTEDEDNVPVIRVEENVPTIRIEPAPAPAGGGAGQQPSLFN